MLFSLGLFCTNLDRSEKEQPCWFFWLITCEIWITYLELSGYLSTVHIFNLPTYPIYLSNYLDVLWSPITSTPSSWSTYLSMNSSIYQSFPSIHLSIYPGVLWSPTTSTPSYWSISSTSWGRSSAPWSGTLTRTRKKTTIIVAQTEKGVVNCQAPYLYRYQSFHFKKVIFNFNFQQQKTDSQWPLQPIICWKNIVFISLKYISSVVRKQTLSLLGLLGALDPYKHKMNLGQIDTKAGVHSFRDQIHSKTFRIP